MTDSITALIKHRSRELARLLAQGPPPRGSLRVGYLRRVEELRLDLKELLAMRRRIRELADKRRGVGKAHQHR